MCLLNGEVSGSIGVQTDFGTIEEEDADGVWTIRPIPIPEIIRNMVHTYGGEPYHNIIIKDLNTYGLELLEYRYENMPLVLYRLNGASTYTNMQFLDSDVPFYETVKDVKSSNKASKAKYLSSLSDDVFDTLINTFGSNPVEGKKYYTGVALEDTNTYLRVLPTENYDSGLEYYTFNGEEYDAFSFLSNLSCRSDKNYC